MTRDVRNLLGDVRIIERLTFVRGIPQLSVVPKADGFGTGVCMKSISLSRVTSFVSFRAMLDTLMHLLRCN